MKKFWLNHKTTIQTEQDREPIRRAVQRFYRDVEMTLTEEAGVDNVIRIVMDRGQQEEWYRIQVRRDTELLIEASDELGVVYALLEISRRFLGILPFWFWNDQCLVRKAGAEIPDQVLEAEQYAVRFRGWFLNDEVLISHWNAGKSDEYPWEMAMEALLRCGGNMVIPGTDRNSKRYGKLASDMGLWITQHHAEPLGAEMFLRAYPNLTPSYREHPEKFRVLWKDAVRRGKDRKIIWNLGFRGQGDVPFWENDPQYDTPEKRGELISQIIREQYDLLTEQVYHPLCCVNLYGETMELYQQGYLKLPDDAIMIWADNGYGKMVSRRQWNHNPRISALPDESHRNADHGLYYHVSFYDLQAANVLTALPNSPEFVASEIRNAYENGIRKFWLVNGSNVKPHVYMLGFLAELWRDTGADPEHYRRAYIRQYYPISHMDETEDFMEKCIQDYFAAMLPYGTNEDEHAGEQFYNYITRVLIHHWMKDGGKSPCEELLWLTDAKDFDGQVDAFGNICRRGIECLHNLLERCRDVENRLSESPEVCHLWRDSWLLQVEIHSYCADGVIRFAEGWQAYRKADYWKAFWFLGQAADCFEQAQAAMMSCGHGRWEHFYDNDCQTDIKQTAYLLHVLMAYVRNLGDGPYFYSWQRQVLDAPEDRNIFLLLNEENHLTDLALYEKMKEEKAGCNGEQCTCGSDSET